MYVKSDRDKSPTCDRYIIVSIDGEWCFIKDFSGSQLRPTSYKVKLSECYTVPHTLPSPSYQSVALQLTKTNVRRFLSSPSLFNSFLPRRTCYIRQAQNLHTPPRTKPRSRKTRPPLKLILFLFQFHLNQDPNGHAGPQNTYRSTFSTRVFS